MNNVAENLRAQFGDVLDALPDATVIVHRTGGILLINRQCERLFGYTRAELLGKPVEVLVPDRYRQGHAAHRNGYFSDPRTRSMGGGLELAARRQDGSEFPVEISLSPLSVDGETVAFAAIRDVSARRKTEAGFRALLEAAPDALVIVDADGVITLINSQVEKVFGYARDELIGQSVEILVPPRLAAHHPHHRKRYFGDPHPRPMGSGIELSGRRKDGTEFPVEISLSPVSTDAGTLVTAAIRDISERTTAEAARREAAERRLADEERLNTELSRRERELQHYLDAMSTFNAKIASDGTILLVNNVAREASGLDLEDLLRTRFEDVPWWSFDVHVKQRVSEAFSTAVAGTAVSYEETLLIGNRAATINFTLVPIFDTHGAVDYVIAEGSDITRRVEAERELKLANQELEAFTYSVSHDLRAPLRQIDGFTRILEEQIGGTLDERAGGYLKRVQHGTAHMGKLIDDLLNLAGVGRTALRTRPIALDDIVRDVLTQLEPETGGRPIDWRIGRLPVVSADPGLMKVVFTNLISNALKYTRPQPDPRISVSALQRDGETIIAVADNGVGFDMKYADKLFGVFQRLHRADQFEGTGVGLATVQRIIHKHAGRIWAESEPDAGATFFFTVRPISPDALPVTPP